MLLQHPPSQRTPRLTGATNYRPSQIWMKMYLSRLHLWAYIGGNKVKPDNNDPEIQVWHDKDFETQSEIQFHVTDSLMYLISNQEITKEMWECLNEQYEKTVSSHCFRQLTTLQMQEGDDFETFLQSWCSLLEQGTTAGLGFTDKITSSHAIISTTINLATFCHNPNLSNSPIHGT